MQVLEQFAGDLGQFLRQGRRFKRRDVEDVEEQHRVVGDHGPAGLGDDDRMGDVGLVEDGDDRLDDVGAVFLDRIVAAGVKLVWEPS